jgi:hypothetical protein
MEMRKVFISLVFLACVLVVLSEVVALPVVPGYTVEVYADGIYMPIKLCFGPYGVLFVGNGDNAGNVSIYRIAPGGGPGSVSPYGQAVWDPDPVAYDASGAISGTPGAVLTGGGVYRPPHMTAILPDGTAQQLWPPPPVAFNNPSEMVFDSTGRLLIVDATYGMVYQTTGENPTALFSVPGPAPDVIAVNSQDDIFVAYYGVPGQDVTIGHWSPDGTFLGPFAQSLTSGSYSRSIGFGPGGVWGNNLYATIGTSLYRFDSDGNPTVIGTGFDGGCNDMAFGPDGAMYLSWDSQNRILRVSPILPPAVVAINPDTLDLKSPGKWITCYIELGEDYDVADIDVSTVMLNRQVPAESRPTEIGDYDGDGIADLMVKFDRSAVQKILEVAESVEVTVTGNLTDGTPFEGRDTIRVINPGGKGK